MQGVAVPVAILVQVLASWQSTHLIFHPALDTPYLCHLGEGCRHYTPCCSVSHGTFLHNLDYLAPVSLAVTLHKDKTAARASSCWLTQLTLLVLSLADVCMHTVSLTQYTCADIWPHTAICCDVIACHNFMQRNVFILLTIFWVLI